MAWQYFAVCLCDFILFPAFNAAFYAIWKVPYQEWHPLTLQGGGLYHLAMGGIIGVAVWQRSQEKMAIYGPLPGSVTTARTTETTSSVVTAPETKDGA
jgi:hypothetical protein